MIHWLWAFLTFVVGEFVGLFTFALLSTIREDDPPEKKRRNKL